MLRVQVAPQAHGDVVRLAGGRRRGHDPAVEVGGGRVVCPEVEDEVGAGGVDALREAPVVIVAGRCNARRLVAQN